MGSPLSQILPRCPRREIQAGATVACKEIPHATLYTAILRDLAKGEESRFVKTERGRFTVRS